ncbi:MAG: type II toxin-antitoxin system prevent-host-death family antitoxin [Nitrococcus sp.]|nr:type II toxin-antitoxin system prevent-host-death family antitoxin [Nitrococcus sp.]
MRSRLGCLETLVMESGEILITRRGKPIARLLPIAGRRPKPDHADLRKTMPRLTTPSEVLINADRDER